MSKVMKFDEYSSKGNVNEGLLSALVGKSKITKVQGVVFTKVGELLEKNPDKYKDAKSILRDIERDAKKLYNDELGDMVKDKKIITADEWWKEFAPKAEAMISQDIS